MMEQWGHSSFNQVECENTPTGESQFLNASPDQVKKSLHKHLEEPHISAELYSESQRAGLADAVMKKTRIYLDQKYWIYCRDAKMGRPQRPAHVEIWELLRTLVSSGRAVCPASYPVLAETFKQGDNALRLYTAEVVDDLSQGAAIQPLDRLVCTQLVFLMTKSDTGAEPSEPLSRRVWTYVGYMLSEAFWRTKGADPAMDLALKKTVWDIWTGCSFKYLVTTPGLAASLKLKREQGLERKFIKELSANQGQRCTFEHAYIREIQTYWKVLAPLVADMERGVQRECTLKGYKHVSYNPDWQRLQPHEFPSLHIRCAINAAMTREPHRFSKGFLADLLHAEYALPFCNLFLTEHNLGTLITKKPLELDKMYQCCVLWDDKAIVQKLRSLQ